MSYEEYMSKFPDDTRRLLINAMKIYKLIKDKEIICNKTDIIKGKIKVTLSVSDKRCAAIFISALVTDTNVKKVFEEYDYDVKKVINLFDLYPLDIPNVSEEELDKIYNDDFKVLFFQVTESRESKGKTSPEQLICNLSFKHICGSSVVDIIDEFVTEGHVLGFYKTDIYNYLRSAVNLKLENQGIKRKSDMKGLPSGFNDSSQSFIEQYGEVLTNNNYRFNPAVGREEELKRAIITLLTPNKSLLIIGEPGVGKTALVEGLAYLISSKKVPKYLENVQIIKINTSSLINGCMYVGMFEERIEGLLKEIMERKNVILFVDEMHTVIGAGAGSKSNLDLANILKPYLDRGQIKMIGATTNEEYEDYIAKDGAFKRRYGIVNVNEPDEKMLFSILMQAILSNEKISNVAFGFSDYERSVIVDFIVNITAPTHRVYKDKENNPSLALSVLGSAFAYAMYRGDNVVKVEDVANAVANYSSLYESFRKSSANFLIQKFSYLLEGKEKDNNVVPFPGMK